jgi:fermentation-respiration switch protein FrsA (DUF1100 family)
MLKSLLSISLLTVCLINTAVPQTNNTRLTGIWQGALKISGFELHIVFNVSDTDGKLSTTLDSPDQNAYGIKVDSTYFRNDSVYFGIPGIQGFYYGIYATDSITGTWHQGGNQWALVLKKTDKVEKPKRPQLPEKPYPYNEEEVSFSDTTAGVELAGTLTTPKEGGPFPAVVLVTGSGPQDRNESLLGHEPFLVLADYLTRHGIAVLRYDDRGVGKSTGTFSTATTEDFVDDALAAVKFLNNRKDIKSDETGILGHSEGGLIAPLAAVRSNDVDFIVLMAGPGVTGKAILLEQSKLIEKAMGMSDEKIEKGEALAGKFYNVVENEKDSSKAAEKIKGLYHEYYATLDSTDKAEFGNDPETVFDRQALTLLSPWFKFFLSYDPGPTLEKVKVPVLAINGENDLQVPPKQNLPAIEDALKKGGNRDYKVVEIPKLNHLFQTSETGSPTEYSKIEETISPKALEIIGNWILDHTKK